jgi:hypothetical protein
MQAHQRFLDGEMDAHVARQFDQGEMYGRPFVFRADRKFESVDDLEHQALCCRRSPRCPSATCPTSPLATPVICATIGQFKADSICPPIFQDLNTWTTLIFPA